MAFKTPIQKNQTAPGFSTPDEHANIISSEQFLNNQNIILYFYPKDDTSGCTIEANQFTALIEEFSAADTIVLGVSRDDCQSHQDFIKKFDLKVHLLADTDETLCNSYGVIQEKEKNGVKKMGIVRSTFIIDKEGIVREAIYGVTADGHAQAMLDIVKTL